MFDQSLNIKEELPKISPEYQDTFRRALENELAETGNSLTDMEALAYLRRRREDFENGAFIRPDGHPGLVVLSPGAAYGQAMSEIVRDTLGQSGHLAERRQTLITIGVLTGVAIVIFFLIIKGQNQPGAENASPTPAAAGTPASATAVPTPPLPEITGAEESLQTIGGLGGALTIGRPSAIELHYRQTEETIALAIDPSRPTPRGELRFNEITMGSDNPVAVWLFGTVLNYAIGIPDSMVRNLAPGDTVILSTDTGAALHFVVTETQQGASYEAGRLLSQNRLGLTLFALPAVGEEAVAVALANYDVTSEADQSQGTPGLGERVSFGSGGELVVNEAAYSHLPDGLLRIVVGGEISGPNSSQSLLLTIAAAEEQTSAVELMPDEDGGWEAEFIIATGGVGGVASPLLAEFRSLPDGATAVVGLGEIPRLIDQLEIEIARAWWEGEAEQVAMTLSLHNPGKGAVYIDPDFIQFPGGEAYDGKWQVSPGLPFLIAPGQTTEITVTFLPQTVSVQIQIGAGLWEVAEIPLLSPDRQPVNGGG